MKVIKGKVKDVELPEKADILISEPIYKKYVYTPTPTHHKHFTYDILLFTGTLLVNERMLE